MLKILKSHVFKVLKKMGSPIFCLGGRVFCRGESISPHFGLPTPPKGGSFSFFNPFFFSNNFQTLLILGSLSSSPGSGDFVSF